MKFEFFPWLNNLNRKQFVAIIFICLAVARIIWPAARIDAITLLLIGLAILQFKPEIVKDILKFIKKIKIGGTEIELIDDVKRIDAEVTIAQEAISEEKEMQLPENLTKDIENILLESSKDPRSAFLLLSSKIEKEVRDRIHDSVIKEKNQFMPIMKLIQLGINEGIFPKEVLSPFRHFWSVRNRIVHGEAFEVNSSLIFSLISLGNEILKMVSAYHLDFKVN